MMVTSQFSIVLSLSFLSSHIFTHHYVFLLFVFTLRLKVEINVNVQQVVENTWRKNNATEKKLYGQHFIKYSSVFT